MDKDTTPQSVPEQASANVESPIVEELLVEEISIDGMCGVY
jgi:mycofactocin precursor